MTTRMTLAGAGGVAALLARTGCNRPYKPWDQPLPSLTVELRPVAEMATGRAPVEAVPAPAIQFPALLQADPNHVSPVLSPVVVTPSGPGDSLAAVPPSAVVQLPLGPAVFVPLDSGRYDVRWVVTGPTVHGKLLVREGVRVRTSVVAQGLATLAEAARDSLARRSQRP